MTDLTKKIADARRLDAQATPGPWAWDKWSLHSDTDHIIWPNNSTGKVSENGWSGLLGSYGAHAEAHAKDNADMIAHARNHHAALWDVVAEADYLLQTGSGEAKVRLRAALARLEQVQP